MLTTPTPLPANTCYYWTKLSLYIILGIKRALKEEKMLKIIYQSLVKEYIFSFKYLTLNTNRTITSKRRAAQKLQINLFSNQNDSITNDQTNIDKYREDANIKEYHMISKLFYVKNACKNVKKKNMFKMDVRSFWSQLCSSCAFYILSNCNRNLCADLETDITIITCIY